MCSPTDSLGCPSAADHARLSRLLALLGDALGQGDFKAQGTSTFHSFLTSDLGAPLPLHISLSRPFVLPTAAKAGFLAGLTAAVASSGVAPFDVSLAGLDWFCSPDSARAFLVLRAVVQDGSACNAGTEAQTQTPVKNKPLVALLQRCNEQVTAAGQPALYATKGDGAHDAAADDNDDNDDDDGSRAASAFHVSVAWTLAADLAAWSDATQQAYEKWRQDDDDDDNADGHGNMTPLRIRVDSIKAKIGNVVTDIPLRKAGVSSAASAAAVQQRPSKRTRSDEVSKGPVDTSDTKQPRTKRSLFGI